ncbi:hypothetical protein K438DRAFT_1761237 [Mycena galopus ATCC 62051]|nr:hypothetical protein K438DRAFT_1761237 [Mycena galopus ATCC 62051]
MRLASILTIALRAMNSLLGTALILNSPVTLYTNGEKLWSPTEQIIGEKLNYDKQETCSGRRSGSKGGSKCRTNARLNWNRERPEEFNRGRKSASAVLARGRAGPTERGVLDAPLGAVAVIRVSAPCVFNILQQQYLRLKTGLQKGIDLGDAH